jgi:hypothetical protein
MNAMRTPTPALRLAALLLAVAAQSHFLVPSWAQNSITNVPIVSIRAAAPETREPFCDPAICDAALPAPGVFVVTRRGGDLARELAVSMAYSGTATSGADYPALPGFVNFGAGQASVELRVEAAYDQLPEGDETVVAQVLPDPSLGPIERYRVDPLQAAARVIIHDHEAPETPVVSLHGGGTAPEFCPPNAFCAGLSFLLRRTGPLDRPLTVRLAYGGTATAGVDYRSFPDTATFGIGQAQTALFSAPIDDTLVEGDETVLARLLPPDPSIGGAYHIDPANASAAETIRDNDTRPDPVVSIEATGPIAEESSAPLRRLALRGRFTITRTGATSNAVHVFVLVSGTATPGADYPFLPWLVTIPPETNRIELEVTPNPDDLAEPIEIVEATLSECPPLTDPPLGVPCYGANIDPARSSARVFIRDDGITTASLEITAPKDGEEFSEGTPIRIAATAIDLDGAMTHADFFGGDRKIGESTIVFIREPDPGTPIYHEFEWRGAAAGPHALTARAVNAAGDAVTSAPVRITVGGPALPVVSIEATVPEAIEPSPTTRVRPGVFTLRRTGDASGGLRVWVRYSGTATSGEDYQTPPGIVEFPAGAASVEVLIGPLDDDLVEGDEAVIAELTPSPLGIPPQYVIDPATSRARVIIHDNDGPVVPVVSIRATQPYTAEPCPVCLIAPGVFTISRTGPTQNSLFVQLAARGTATPGDDYRPLPALVEIPAGRESMEVLVLPNDDPLAEGDETVIAVLLPDPSLGPIEPYRVDPEHSQDTVIIRDNDSPFTPIVSIRATHPETQEPVCPPDTCAAPTPAPGVFTVTRRGGDRNHALTVLLRYGGSAMPRADYDPLPESVTIPAGLESVELYVAARFDEAMEGDETVMAALQPDSFIGLVERYRIDPAQASARVVIHDRTPPTIPMVTIVATDPFAREGAGSNTGLNTATFEVRRAGETNSNLTVSLGVGGTAVNGVDYATIPSHVTIPAGRRSARILVTPIDDNLREKIETVIIEVFTPPVPAVIPPVPPTYLGGGRAAAIIVDNDHPRPPCLRLPDGLFNVCLPVAGADCFRVESTRDFKDWRPLCIVPANEGAAHYVDPDAPDSPRQFYRLVPVACEPEE